MTDADKKEKSKEEDGEGGSDNDEDRQPGRPVLLPPLLLQRQNVQVQIVAQNRPMRSSSCRLQTLAIHRG